MTTVNGTATSCVVRERRSRPRHMTCRKSAVTRSRATGGSPRKTPAATEAYRSARQLGEGPARRSLEERDERERAAGGVPPAIPADRCGDRSRRRVRTGAVGRWRCDRGQDQRYGHRVVPRGGGRELEVC